MTNRFPGASLTIKIVAKCYGFVNTSLAFPRRVKGGAKPPSRIPPLPLIKGKGIQGMGSPNKIHLWITYEYN